MSPTPVQVYITAGQSYELESKLRKLEQSAKNRFGGATDSELSELEDVMALTAARVQSAGSEVGPESRPTPGGAGFIQSQFADGSEDKSLVCPD